MKQLKLIQFKNLTLEERKDYRFRKAVRAVVFDSDNKIGLLQVTKNNYHKLPGGGIEKGEDIVDALRRECLEEIGCQINIGKELGIIIEYRDKIKVKQESHCYIAEVAGSKGNPSFTKKEKNKGFKVKWIFLKEAIKKLESDNPNDCQGKFIQIRDLTYLKEADKQI